MKKFTEFVVLVTTLLLVSSCSLFNWSKSCKNEYNENYKGSYKIGSPYSIKNVTYYPKKHKQYKQTGLASWYGDDFHCKKTANGQYFNKHELTAAHRTLPLPSVARVTNLKNNRSINVIINDRGPFVKGDNRIIDVSENAAINLGMKSQGVAPVEVEYLPHETNELLAKLNFHKHIDPVPAKNYNWFSQKKISKPKLVKQKENIDNELVKYSILVANCNNHSDAVKSVKALSRYGDVKVEQFYFNSEKLFNVKLSGMAKSQSKVAEILDKVKFSGYKEAKLIS